MLGSGIETRRIEPDWIIQVLENPVSIIEDADVIIYYGPVIGRNTLLKVMIRRDDDRIIETAHFDTAATRRYRRGTL